MNVEIGRQSILFLFRKWRDRAVSFLGIHKSEPDFYIGFSSALHLQCILVPKANDTKASFSVGYYQGLGWLWLRKKKDMTDNEGLSFRVIAMKSAFLNPFLTEKNLIYILHKLELKKRRPVKNGKGWAVGSWIDLGFVEPEPCSVEVLPQGLFFCRLHFAFLIKDQPENMHSSKEKSGASDMLWHPFHTVCLLHIKDSTGWRFKF